MQVAGIDRSWLGVALDLDPATISDLTFERVDMGQSADTYRVAFRDAASGAGRSVILKVTANRDLDLTSGIGANYLREVRFYQTLAPTLSVRVPACRYARIADNGIDFTLLLEDLAPCEPGDDLAGCTVESARLVVTELARLHGSQWMSPQLKEQSWLTRTRSRRNDTVAALPSMFAEFKARYARVLDKDAIEIGERFFSSISDFYEAQAVMPWTLVHGDLRPGNLMFGASDGAVPLAIIDWQSVQIGPSMLDVSYFIGSNLTPERRRESDRSLVSWYHHELIRNGVEHYSADDCWRDYGLMSFQTYLGGVGAAMTLPRTATGDRAFTLMVERASAQIRDAEAFAQLAP